MLLTLQTGNQVRKDFGRKLLDDYPVWRNPRPTGSQNNTSTCQTPPSLWPASLTGTHTIIPNSASVCKVILPETETITNSTHNLKERQLVGKGERKKMQRCLWFLLSLHNEPDSQLMHSLIFPFIPIELWYSVQLLCLTARLRTNLQTQP